jgi:hypothetical protein
MKTSLGKGSGPAAQPGVSHAVRGARDAPGGLFHLLFVGKLQVNLFFRHGITPV